MVGTDAQDVGVEGRMVDLAQRQTVDDDRLAVLVSISQDVCCVEKLRVSQATHGATGSVHAL